MSNEQVKQANIESSARGVQLTEPESIHVNIHVTDHKYDSTRHDKHGCEAVTRLLHNPNVTLETFHI